MHVLGWLSSCGCYVADCANCPLLGESKASGVPNLLRRGMELRVIDKSDELLSIEIAGEDHTFMNVLKGALLEMDDVTAATYDMNPEQSGGQTDPVLTVKTESGVDALDALETGAERVIEKSEAFRTAYEAAA